MINTFIMSVNSSALYLGMGMFNNVMRCMPMVHKSTSLLKCRHMTFIIITVKKAFLLQTKTQDYHIIYPNVLLNVIM